MKKHACLSLFLSSLLLSSCITLPMNHTFEETEKSNQNHFIHVLNNTDYSAHVVEYEYNIPERYYSDGLKNIVRRARQISEYKWTPLLPVYGFNGETVFIPHEEVIGLPYGQPVYNGKFLCYEESLDDFFIELKHTGSPIYTDTAKYEETAPYYSLDCSTFICYVWALDRRMIASLLTKWGDYCGSTVNDIRVGDALIAVGASTHAVLVTGIKEDENQRVRWVEITEMTPPLAKVTRYGDGEMFSLNEFISFYFDKGYNAYRNTDFIHKTPYEHICSSPIDNVRCDKCDDFTVKSGISILSDNSSITVHCEYGDKNAVAFSYTVEERDYGLLKYCTPSGSEISMLSSPENGDIIYYIPAGTVITTSETKEKDGDLFGKVRSGGQCGWVKLSDCTHISGTLERSDPKEYKALIDENNATADIAIENSDIRDGCIVHFYVMKTDGSIGSIGKIEVKKN